MSFRSSLANGVGLALLVSTLAFTSCSAEDTNLFEETSADTDAASGGTTGAASTTGNTVAAASGGTSGTTATTATSAGGSADMTSATTGGASNAATGTTEGSGGSAGSDGVTGSGGTVMITCADTELLCDGECVDVEENDESCGDCDVACPED